LTPEMRQYFAGPEGAYLKDFLSRATDRLVRRFPMPRPEAKRILAEMVRR